MEDVLLLQFLRKKGIISDRDMHEFHELASANMSEEPVYLSKEAEHKHGDNQISESGAKNLVSKMYHVESGRKYIGKKFDIYRAKEIYDRYRGMLPAFASVYDVYIAINSQYHNYAVLFKSWFGSSIDTQVIESAINFWFGDDDCMADNKVHKYFMK